MNSSAEQLNTKRHVVHFIHSSSGGGTETTLMQLLSQHEFHCLRHSVILSRQPVQSYPTDVETCVIEKCWRFDFRLARLKAKLTDLAPDVIHCWSETLALPVTIVSRWLGIPCVISFRNRYSPFRMYDLSLFLAALLSRHVITNVPEGYQHCFYRMNGYFKSSYIENGVAECFLNVDTSSRCETKKLLLAGRITKQKRPGLVIKAFLKYCDGGGVGELHIVGDGSLRSKLELLVAKSIHQDRVVFHGWQDSLFPVLGESVAIVSMSSREGTPNVLLEAMACGCIPICSDISPHRALLGDDWPFLVKSATTSELTWHLKELFTLSPRRISEFSEAVRTRVLGRDWEKTAGLYRQVYQELALK